MTMKNLDPHTLKAWLDRDEAVLIDVREGFEYADEYIDGAVHMPLSAFNSAGLPDLEDRVVVYTCASGKRTDRYSAQLQLAAASAQEVYHLDGGMMAWNEAGFDVAEGEGGELPDAMPHIGAIAGQGAPCAPAG
jgi:rhodanese-related sulfurtransferase